MISYVYAWFSVYLHDVLIGFFHARTVDQLDQSILPQIDEVKSTAKKYTPSQFFATSHASKNRCAWFK